MVAATSLRIRLTRLTCFRGADHLDTWIRQYTAITGWDTRSEATLLNTRASLLDRPRMPMGR